MNWHNKVAFVTGAASGIGFALARECARRGMRVMMADVDSRLNEAVDTLSAEGGEVIGAHLDVRDHEQYQAVANRLLDSWGVPHLLFNNAGVSSACPVGAGAMAEWDWLIDVNLKGVARGIGLFLPAMTAGGAGGHIVNTASIAGLSPSGGATGGYSVTKHAVVALSESLAIDLFGSEIGVSVLCPGRVTTEFMDIDRVRPKESGPATDDPLPREQLRSWLAGGIAPNEVANMVFAAIEQRRFYILPHPEYKVLTEQRAAWLHRAFDGEKATDEKIVTSASARLSQVIESYN